MRLVTSRTEVLPRGTRHLTNRMTDSPSSQVLGAVVNRRQSLCHLLVLLQGHHLGHLIVGVEVVRVQGDPLATEGLLVTRGLASQFSVLAVISRENLFYRILDRRSD